MLVSAIMPTRGRKELALTAVECFLAQDYEEKELVILDDADDPSFTGLTPHPAIRHILATKRMTIGSKLEYLSQEAKGEIMIRFDSDDWSAPDRISTQVKRLEASGKGLTGYHSLLFWDCQRNRGHRWKFGTSPFCCGTSMCYTKDWWKKHHWPSYANVNGSFRIDGTDTQLVKQAINDSSCDSVDGGQMCVARAHGNNTSNARKIQDLSWPLVPASEFPPAFFEAIQKRENRKCA